MVMMMMIVHGVW